MNNGFVLSFCFKLGTTALEMHELLKGKNSMGRTQILSGVVFSNMGKCQLKIMSIQIIHPKVGQMKTSNKVPLWRSLAG
jgi:hypothetical protein